MKVAPSSDDHDPKIGYLTIEIPEHAPAKPEFSLNQALRYALAATAGGPAGELGDALRAIGDTYPRAFKKVLTAMAASETISEEVANALRSHWVVVGFRARAAVKDDALFIRAFRRAFPPYAGGGLVLYRGERGSEIAAGRLGLNWSSRQETARVFAAGLCRTYGCDGVLLTAVAPASAIIAGPTEHSIYLDEWEHVVDPNMLHDVTEIGRFPPFG